LNETFSEDAHYFYSDVDYELQFDDRLQSYRRCYLNRKIKTLKPPCESAIFR